jgi:hypothetical protein
MSGCHYQLRQFKNWCLSLSLVFLKRLFQGGRLHLIKAALCAALQIWLGTATRRFNEKFKRIPQYPCNLGHTSVALGKVFRIPSCGYSVFVKRSEQCIHSEG